MNIKHSLKISSAALAAFLLAGCTAAPPADGAAADAVQPPPPAAVTFTDVLDHEVTLERWDRVVSLYGSFAETWLLAGGTLVGTTEDAVSERGLELGEDVAVVGTVKEPSLEEVLALSPDFVILSADVAGQVKLHGALAAAEVPHAYYRVDAFADYLAMLEQFCLLTGREDLYEENGLAVREQIDAILASVEGKTGPTALLIRAYSTGAKAKGDDNLAGVILRDLGADNLVDRYESMLEDVSMEEVIAADPDFIFITTMGAEDKALAFMTETFEESPAWAGLSAVKNGQYVLLPKELFHYKPNARWGESYAYLAEILYPELAGKI
ncbi:ABC transporter substrate-binding protein [Oscillospiraceae bacterium 50-60]